MAEDKKAAVAKLVADTKQILKDTRPAGAPKADDTPSRVGAKPTPWLFTFQGLIADLEPYNEVYPNILLGQGTAAQDIKKLRDLKVTHVVNTAMGKKFTQIDTSEEYYEPFKIKFYGFQAMDVMTYPIQKHFHATAEFIDQALKEGGKVFVHCHQGRSRSASIVLSYLMLYKGMTIQEAMKTVRLKREVTPNDGFLRKLCELNWDIQNKTMNSVGDSNEKDAEEQTADDGAAQNATVE